MKFGLARAHLNSMRASFWQEARSIFPNDLLFGFVSALGPGIIAAWIVRQAGESEAASYLLLGAPLYAVWAQGVTRVAGSLQGEHSDGLLEPLISTSTPLVATMMAKAAAVSCVALLPGAAVLAIVLLYADGASLQGTPLLIVPSLLLALAAIVITAISFQPLTFLIGSPPDAVTAIMPVTAVLSGFLYPVTELPLLLELLARCLPVSWAMEALSAAGRGEAAGPLVIDWLLALLAGSLSLALSVVLFGLAERRIRRSGVLARS